MKVKCVRDDRNCLECDECLYIGEGDYWCSKLKRLVGSDFLISGPGEYEADDSEFERKEAARENAQA